MQCPSLNFLLSPVFLRTTSFLFCVLTQLLGRPSVPVVPLTWPHIWCLSLFIYINFQFTTAEPCVSLLFWSRIHIGLTRSSSNTRYRTLAKFILSSALPLSPKALPCCGFRRHLILIPIRSGWTSTGSFPSFWMNPHLLVDPVITPTEKSFCELSSSTLA